VLSVPRPWRLRWRLSGRGVVVDVGFVAVVLLFVGLTVVVAVSQLVVVVLMCMPGGAVIPFAERQVSMVVGNVVVVVNV
jgi:hypothetical protein